MLTIVIPTKNNETILITNLENNFIGKTPENVKVLIHDNSTSSSARIKSLISGQHNFTYVHNNNLLSVGENFHHATVHVSTKYFCFIGDDDFIHFESWPLIISCLTDDNYDNITFPVYSLYFWKGSNCKYISNLTTSGVMISMGPMLRSFYTLVLLVIRVLTKSERIALCMPDLADLPKVYYGIVNTSFYRSKFSNIWGSPDSFIAGRLGKYLQRHRTKHLLLDFFVPGTSKGSTAGLSNRRAHDGKISEQIHFNRSEKDKLSAFELDLFLPEIIWTLSFLLAQDKPLTVQHREILYFYIFFKYRKSYWSVFFPKTLGLNRSFMAQSVSFTIAGLAFIVNRTAVASVIFCRYFLASRATD